MDGSVRSPKIDLVACGAGHTAVVASRKIELQLATVGIFRDGELDQGIATEWTGCIGV